MKLVRVNANFLVNPDRISAVTMKKVKGSASYYAMIDGNLYPIDVEIVEFLKSIQRGEGGHDNFHFAG